MKKLRIYLLLLSALFLVLQSCQTEELPVETDGPLAEPGNTINVSELPAEIRAAIQDTEVALKHPDLGLKGIPFGEPDLSLINISETDGATSYTMLLPKVGEGLYFDNLIVQKDPDGTVYAQIQRYEPEPQWWAQQDVSAPRYDNFNGTVRSYNATGEAFAAAELVDGAIHESVSMTTATGRSGCVIVDIQYAGVVVGGHFHVTEIRTTYACGSGDGGGNYGGDDDYGDDGHNGGGGFGGNGNGGGEPTNTDPIVDDNGNFNEDPEIVEVKIENDIDKPCQANIVNEANIQGSTIAQKVNEAFGNPSLGYDLVYINDDIPQLEGSTTVAGTTVTVNSQNRINSITITFDNTFLNNATDVSIFQTALHENLHAYMYYQLDKEGITVANPDGDYSAMANAWSKMIAMSTAPRPVGNDNIEFFQHEIISKLVEEMADIIKDYASSKGYQISETQAEGLAWSNLDRTVAWGFVDSELKEIYEQIFENEVTGFDILAVGRKCP